MNSLIQIRKAAPLFLIVFALGCFALLPRAQAVGPDTEGNIPGANNGEGVGVLVSRTTGVWNTGTGFEALNHLTAGNQNTATGLRALFSDTNGGFNTATGVYSLFNNTSGFFNSATGGYSLANNTTGSYNTANGYGALNQNTSSSNTATGFGALFKNTTGSYNTANGYLALNRNTTGYENTANGAYALFSNTTGNNNTANGLGTLNQNTTGVGNTALGNGAGANLTTGNGNVCIGAGVFGVAGESDTTWIRNVNTLTQNFSAGANNYVTVRLSDGRLGNTAVVSSQRYKEDIKPLDKTSQALFALKPVSFRLKKEFDPTQAFGFGLIAEEVEKVDPALVYRNDKGQVESVRYEMVNAMLLNEFLKEHRKVEKLEVKLAEQEKKIEALTAGLQRVSAQVELNKIAPQIVLKNQ